MRFLFAIKLIIVLLGFQPDVSLCQCDNANWQSSLDHPGWSVCPRSTTYLRGLWRNDNQPGDERVGRIETARCCPGTEPYRTAPSTCRNADWSRTLDG